VTLDWKVLRALKASLRKYSQRVPWYFVSAGLGGDVDDSTQRASEFGKVVIPFTLNSEMASMIGGNRIRAREGGPGCSGRPS